MIPVLMAAGLPLDGVGILLAVDTVPDMFRTTANITGAMTLTAILPAPRGLTPRGAGRLRIGPMSEINNPAELYERYFVPAMFRPWAAILVRRAALAPGERALDVACGTGIVAREAAPLLGEQGRIAAVDVNPGMLAVARSLPAPAGAPIDWLEGSALALPVPDGSIGVVLCQHALPFFPDRAAAVRQMRHVLAPRGRAAVIVLQSLARHPLFDLLMRATARSLAVPLAEVITPFSLPDSSDLRGLFDDAGFARVEVVEDSIVARFAEPHRFVSLTVASASAAVPAFAALAAPERAALLAAVGAELAPALAPYREGDTLAVPLFAHVALATA